MVYSGIEDYLSRKLPPGENERKCLSRNKLVVGGGLLLIGVLLRRGEGC